MTELAITGWGAICPDGGSLAAIANPAAVDRGAADAPRPAADRAWAGAPAVDTRPASLDVRAVLGRKGTSFLDRGTGMAVVGCGLALADSGIQVGEHNRARVGVVLGTTVGSLKSTSEYSQETLEQEKPYLVNPMLFPNTVMNRAAGQSAIWYGLKGVNATVAGGQLAFFNALRYATNALRRGYADAVLVGAVEELSDHAVWAHQLTSRDGAAGPVGEGGAVVVLERAAEAREAGRAIDAEVLACVTAFRPDGRQVAAGLATCVSRALHRARVGPDDVTLVLSSLGEQDNVTREAVATVFAGHDLRHACVTPLFGQCYAASGALQAAAALEWHRGDARRDGLVCVLTAHSTSGGVAAAVIRGWSRGGTGRG